MASSRPLSAIRGAMREIADADRAATARRFFKTAPGEYGHGDEFLGIRVPDSRRIARAHRGLSRADTIRLLASRWHEERLVALLLLVDAHQRGTTADRMALHLAYLANTALVDNWDLVDTSASELVGTHIAEGGTACVERLARSASLWERRIAIIATFAPLRAHDFGPTLHIAEMLLGDGHDLIHKAVGWMLREVGNRNGTVARRFLKEHGATMPRTTLRYAIERFSPAERKRYLAT
jgi:3-methyladenine DNA glycosylase AlkD